MDYDRTGMAKVYDRARSHDPGTLAAWFDAFIRHARSPKTILDLACGTGRFTQALADRLSADVIGVDRSQTMLAVARAKPHSASVRFVEGSAEAIPLDDETIDLVFMSMLYHHLDDAIAVTREVRRVLRPGGVLLIRNGVRDLPTPYDSLFPGYRDVYDARTSSRAEMRRDISAGGLAFVTEELVPHQMSPNWRAFADKTALRADSNLALMRDEAYNASMAALRRFAETANPNQPVMIDVPLLVFERPL